MERPVRPNLKHHMKHHAHLAPRCKDSTSTSTARREGKGFRSWWLALATLCFLAVLPATAQAQANAANYAFSTATTASLTDMSTGTTTLLADNLDDNASPVTLIGFDFFFQGVRQDRFSVNANGSLRFGATVISSTLYDPLGQASQSLITAYGADQRTHAGDGKVHYKVFGAAPNRVLVVEWRNMQANFNAGGTADLTYQLRLSETTGTIEFVYGSMTMSAAGAADVNSSSPQIGFSSSNLVGTVGSVTAPQSGVPAPTFSGASAVPVNNLYTAGPISVLTSAADGARRSFLLTPPAVNPPGGPLTFTGVSTTSMTLNWTDSPNEASYAIYASTDGVNFSFFNSAALNATSFVATNLLGSATYTWQVHAVSEGQMAFISGVQATPAPTPKTSVGSGLWSAPETWSNNAVPAAGDAVTIAAGTTVTIDTAAIAYSVSVAGSGALQFEQTTARTLTVGTDVMVQNGGTLQSNLAGSQTGHILSLGGNLVNDGTLDFSTNADTAGVILTFTGATNNTFSGTGATTDIRQITINKGISSANILELMPANFTVRGVTTDTVVGGWLVMTNGTIKISGTFAGTSRMFAVSAYTIPASFGVWLNNPNYVVAAQSGNAVNNGLFRLTQGTFNQGTLATHSFRGGAGAIFTIEGGTLNCAAQFSPQSAVTYNQSGGTVNVGLVGNSQSNFGTFDLFSTAATFNMTGGTINIAQASVGAIQVDYRMQANVVAATGTLQVGTGTTVTKFTFTLRGPLPNLVIDNTTNNKTASAAAQIDLLGSTTINPGSTLVINGQTCVVKGSTFTNNGTLTGTNASSILEWTGNGSGLPQTYTGSGVTSGPIARMNIKNPGGLTFTSTNQLIVGRIDLLGGGITHASKLTLGDGGATTVDINFGSITTEQTFGGFDEPPVFNPGTGGVNLTYNSEPLGSTRTTGHEIPPSRTLNRLSIINTTFIPFTIAGGDLIVSGGSAGALNLTTARVFTGANTLYFNTEVGTVTRDGGWVVGNFKKSFAAAGAREFEVGDALDYAPVTVDVTAGNFPADFTVKAVDGKLPQIPGANALQRYWSLSPSAGSGLTANLTFNYYPEDVVGNLASYVFARNDAGTLTELAPASPPTDTQATINGVSEFSDWTLAEPTALVSVQFSAASYSVNENAGTATITVNRLGSGGAVVNYATSNGSAIEPGDYEATSGTLTWLNGDPTAKTFTVPIVNNALFDGDRTVNLTLSSPGATLLGTPATAVLAILEDEPEPPGILQFSAPTYSIGETGVVATIAVTRTHGAVGAVSVDYATSNGTAIEPGDYTAASGTLSWVNAEGGSKTFTVSIANNALFDGDRTVNLTLSGPTGGAVLGATASAVLTIIEDELEPPGTLQFSSATYSVAEDGGGAMITVTRTHGAVGPVTVSYATSNGTATEPGDYLAASGTLSWDDAETGSKSFAVSVTDDGIFKGNRTVNLTLSSPTGGAVLGTASTAVLTILENEPEPPGALEFSMTAYSVAENGGVATITVTRTNGAVGAVSINYATGDGTATEPGDYTGASGTLSWANAETASKTFTVGIANNAIFDGNRTVTLSLSSPTGGAVVKATGMAVLTILEDEVEPPGTLEFSAATYSVSETGPTATITVTRKHGAVGAVSVDYATSNGTATQPGDYTAASGTLSWAGAETASKTFTVSVADNAIYDGNRTVNLTLSSPTGGAVLGTVDTAVLTITEDEPEPPGTLEFSAPTYSIAEGGPVATITVTRTRGAVGAVSVNFATSNGTAAEPGDYTATSGTITWSDDDTASKSFTIPIIEDTDAEGPETANLVLSDPSGGAILGGVANATLTILDNEAGQLQFSAAAYSVTEDGVSAVITVSRTGGRAGAVSVSYATSDGTATAGADYTTATGTLNWGDGDGADKTFLIPIIKDADNTEPNETMTLTLSAPTGGVVLGTPATAAVLTILKSDGGFGGYTALALGVDPGAEKTGLLKVTVTKGGKFTGKLQLGVDKFSLSGLLDGTGNLLFGKAPGTATKELKRKDGSTLALALQIDVATGANECTGTITNGGNPYSTIEGQRVFYRKGNPFPKTKIVPFTGVFDVPTGPPGLAAPLGRGFATVKFSALGVAKMVGRLADGSAAFTYSGALWETDSLPIYVPFYKGAGALAGTAEFNIHSGDASGPGLLWFRPAGQKGFLDGWAGDDHLVTDFTAVKYVVTKAAPASLPALTANDADGNAELTLADGDLTTPIIRGLGIDPATSKVTAILPAGNEIKLKLSITKASGLFKGSFVHPDTAKTIKFQGALLQNQAVGFGFFLSTDATGTIDAGDVSLVADEQPLVP